MRARDRTDRMGWVGGIYNRCLREARRRADRGLIRRPGESIWCGPGFQKFFRPKPLRGVARRRADFAWIEHTVSEMSADSR